MIVGGVKESVEGTVYLVVLARFYFNRKNREVVVVVNQEINLATLFVVVVVQGEAVGVEFLRDNRLIYGAEIDAAFVSKHRIDVCPVENVSQDSYIAEV